ncbi:MAG: hypothetical protein K0S32_3632 [Bacteroidetes bacterium]|jgi:hypothetical protein|nr:hypothetical protein [Bacteroidota bacterium]
MDQEKQIELLAYEAFLRRASELKLPFMLKGSFVTRQYMPNTSIRVPNDLDWVYMDNLSDIDDAKEKFNAWATAVTELKMDDNFRFRSFSENAFWRMIDYAMADDFPTINTDIKYYYTDKSKENEITGNISFDLSFNLDIEVPPVPLLYNPLEGDAFIVPYTVPLALQISWKIHQSLVRPRFKDLFDLMYLLKHETFNAETRTQALQALVNECSADNVDLKKLEYLLSGNWEPIFPNAVIHKSDSSSKGSSLYETWDYWRYKKKIVGNYGDNILLYEDASVITNPDTLPYNLDVFKKNVLDAFEFAGFASSILHNLPSVTRKSRKTYEEKVNTDALKIKTDIITESVQKKHNSPKTENDPFQKLPEILNKKIEPEPEQGLFKKLRKFFGGN